MSKVVLICGLLAGVLLAGSMLISMSFTADPADMDKGWIVGLITMLLALSTIFLGIRYLRENVYRGKITFLTGLKAGLVITLIASVMYVVTWEIMFHTSFTDFPEQYFRYQVADAQKTGMTGEELESHVNSLRSQRDRYINNTVYRMFITSTEILPMGILVSLISALILKRKEAI